MYNVYIWKYMYLSTKQYKYKFQQYLGAESALKFLLSHIFQSDEGKPKWVNTALVVTSSDNNCNSVAHMHFTLRKP